MFDFFRIPAGFFILTLEIRKAQVMKKLRSLAILLLVLTVFYFTVVLLIRSRDPMIKWNWDKINTSELYFPPGFLWGVATAAYQIEGGFTNSNWNWWENQTKPDGSPTIARGQKCGKADDSWNLWQEDIRMMKRLGVNAYRFSVAWSKIMPRPDSIDTAALRHYQIMCDSLIANGIQPAVTLFHFTYPLWFQEKGGFEREENIKYFVEFAKTVYSALGDRVKYWFTINEPVVFAYSGYFSGEFPPGKQDPELTAIVLDNLLKAHLQVYKALKAMPGGDSIKIGIVKNITQMDPYRKWNLLDNLIAYFADLNFNHAYLKAFKTGHFHFFLPGMVNFKDKIPGLQNSLDFIGLNYYSHYAFHFSFDFDKALTPLPYPGETMTDMDYTIYPEGLYRAIKRVAKLEKPIIITENGIADAKDDRRGQFIERSLYAVSKAIRDGYDVRGYFYWSLMDNFEWNLGYDKRFGLYEVDYKTMKRTLREGAKAYMWIIKRSGEKTEN